MLEAIASDGVRTIPVENASRFARDLIVQETGFRFLQRLGVELIAVDTSLPTNDAAISSTMLMLASAPARSDADALRPNG